MMKDGLIQQSIVDGVEVFIDLIPVTNRQARPKYSMTPTSITIHETGNTRTGANAEMHARYVKSNHGYSSWHFSVDDKEIRQHLPINENSWHAGDGGEGAGNRTSIAIEICINKDGDFEKAIENTRKLVQHLMNETGIKTIVPHKHWKSTRYPNGKQCPRNILASGWDDFVNFLHVDVDRDCDRVKELEAQLVATTAERDFWKSKVERIVEFVEEAQNYGV